MTLTLISLNKRVGFGDSGRKKVYVSSQSKPNNTKTKTKNKPYDTTLQIIMK